MRPLEISGQKFFRLTAVESKGSGIWSFKCDCGNTIERRAALVKSGNTKSCGCLVRDMLTERNKTHGLTNHPLYQRWLGMIARCTNERHVGYKNYGGRGIKVCDRWLNSFENFLKDMGECPEGMTLDRIDGDGDYGPENCRWATFSEQSRNTSRNRIIEFMGESLTVRDWEIKMGVKRGAFQRRLDLGWSEEDAVTSPIQPGKPVRERK